MVIPLKFDCFFKNAVLFVIALSNSPIIITDRPIAILSDYKLFDYMIGSQWVENTWHLN